VACLSESEQAVAVTNRRLRALRPQEKRRSPAGMEGLADPRQFAALLRAMGRRGESAYNHVDGQTVHDIPAQAVRGRAGAQGQTFSGCVDLARGTIRIDCAEELPFHLEIDMAKVPHFAAAPGGAEARAVGEDFAARARAERAAAPPGVAAVLRKLKQAKARIRRLKRAQARVKKAVLFTTRDKGFDLHWLSRRDIDDVLAGGEPRASRPGVVDILAKYPKEAETIRKGGFESNWESGFWSGVCATGRLFAGVAFPTAAEEAARDDAALACLEMEKPWSQYTEAEKDAVEARGAKDAWLEFPMLDS
jgi:hypothetical protein